MTWWNRPNLKNHDGIVCDGSVRSGKTLAMSCGFFLWSMTSFNDAVFAICGKTVGSLRRNVILHLGNWLGGVMELREHRGDNKIVVRMGNHVNTYYLFGGQDEGSYMLIQGITLAGVLMDEVALMPRSFVEQAAARCSVPGSKLWFNCNPGSPEHWFYREWILKAQQKNVLRLHFTMGDNPGLDQKVQLRQTQEDVGTVYPDDPESRNTYAITGNPLLPALSGDSLLPVAQTLYHQLKQVTYTPCTIEMPAGTVIQPGHILTVQDATGRQTQTWIMEKRRRGQRDTLICVGSPLRENSGDANNRDFATLAGKVLHLRTDVDGIKAENRDMAGKLTCVELDLEGLRTKTERLDTLENAQQTLTTQLTQTADKVEILVERTESGQAQQVTTSAGYSFSDAGLQIKRSGESVENLLTHEGMQVSRYGSPILRADKEGVRAVDVSVGNFLIMGDHARFEDYPGSRTACFYI